MKTIYFCTLEIHKLPTYLLLQLNRVHICTKTLIPLPNGKDTLHLKVCDVFTLSSDKTPLTEVSLRTSGNVGIAGYATTCLICSGNIKHYKDLKIISE